MLYEVITPTRTGRRVDLAAIAPPDNPNSWCSMQATELARLMQPRRHRLGVLAGAAAWLLAACTTHPVQPAVPAAGGLSLRILHINDHHSRVAPDSGQVLLLDGEPTLV